MPVNKMILPLSACLNFIAGQLKYYKNKRFVVQKTERWHWKQKSWAIAKMTVRCAQHMSALKIVYKSKISRRLHKNLHITILSLFGVEIILEVSQPSSSPNSDLYVTDRQTDGRRTVASRGKNASHYYYSQYYSWNRTVSTESLQ